MSNIEERLIDCFQTVFPNLSRDEIVEADNTSLTEWDSLATITLISLIEEEFTISITPDDFESLNSFEEIFKNINIKTN